MTAKPKLRRPYRLELPGRGWLTTTYSTEAQARDAVARLASRYWLPPTQPWRITLRAEVVAEGTVK